MQCTVTYLKGDFMGYQLTRLQADEIFGRLKEKYEVWAPMVMAGEGCFSDTDIIRYGNPETLDEIEWEKKSDYSFKEVLISINETLFYFTEDQTIVPKGPEKEILVFLRSCDLCAVKRLDQIYLKNGDPDFYYARVREKVRFILMGCPESCKSGFCVSMGSNHAENYDAYLKLDGDQVLAGLEVWVKSKEDKGLKMVEPNYEGIRINFDLPEVKGWCLLRKSLHDPIMPLNVEVTEGSCETILEIMAAFLDGYTRIGNI